MSILAGKIVFQPEIQTARDMRSNSDIVRKMVWGSEISHKEEKTRIAAVIAGKAKNGEVIGVGSGSTSYLTLCALAERRQREQLSLMVIPTSIEISMACWQLGIPVTTLNEYLPDWTFDGADEIDPRCNLIKGRGGAMFKEKLLIRSSPRVYILGDSSKRVERLGERFPVPVEIVPFSLSVVEQSLSHLSPQRVELRMAEGKDGPVITESGNLILDVWFGQITSGLEQAIKSITGVVESGLFLEYTNVEAIYGEGCG